MVILKMNNTYANERPHEQILMQMSRMTINVINAQTSEGVSMKLLKCSPAVTTTNHLKLNASI